jgi:uncharacterized protein
MIAVDSNILVHAHRRDSPWHERAADSVRSLAERSGAWAIPWPCIHEFFNIVTHARIYRPPSTIDQALAQVDAWLASPSIVLLGEGPEHWATLSSLLRSSRVTGPRVHDARVAAICADHGVRELWTADRDFSSFPLINVRNPLVEQSA